MSTFVLLTITGLGLGAMYFLIASGLSLIYGLMGVLNFAHASLFMLGAYFSWQLSRWIGFWPALVAAPLLCGLVGAAAGADVGAGGALGAHAASTPRPALRPNAVSSWRRRRRNLEKSDGWFT